MSNNNDNIGNSAKEGSERLAFMEFRRGYTDAACKKSPAPNFFLNVKKIQLYLKGYAVCRGLKQNEYNISRVEFVVDFTAGLFEAFCGQKQSYFSCVYDAGYQTGLDALFGQVQD